VPSHLSSLTPTQFPQHRAHALALSVTHAPVHLHISMFQAVVLGVLQA